MVSVPVTSNRSIREVDPEVQSQFRGATPRDNVGGAVANFGRAAQQGVAEFDQIEATYDEADATRIANEYREFERERLRTGENAYLNTQGFGADKSDAVVTELEDYSEGLLGNARSERAQQMARRALNERLNTSKNNIAIHAQGQMQIAREEQSQARITGAVTDAIDARGTDQFAANLALAQQELGDQAVRQGWSEEKLELENEALVSNTYARTALAIDAEDGNPTRALEFVEQNEGLIVPEDEARLIAQLSPRVDQAWARDTLAGGVLEQYLPSPSQSVSAPVAEAGADLNQITANTESNNRDFNSDGSVVTSPVGARFAMQVMPATARDPGFGLRPADPNDAADMNRLGREYRAVMEERYGGDLAKMWAAYNAGPGRTDQAIAAHGDNWLANMPAETRAYVQKNIAAVEAAGGNVPRAGIDPTGAIEDPRLNSRTMRQAVDAYIADNPSLSERRQNALYAEADRMVSIARADRAQAEGDADRALQDWLTQNMADPDALTSVDQIPAAILGGTSTSAQAAISSRVQATQSRIEARNNAAAAARANEQEQAAVFELYTLTDEELAQVDLRQYAGRIGVDKLGPWVDRQQRAASSGGSSGGVSSDRIASRIDTLGKDFGASRAAGASEDERQAWIGLRGYVEQRVAGRANGDVSNEELRSIIIGGMQEVEIQGSGWSFGMGLDVMRSAAPRSQLPSDAQAAIDDIPADAVDDIRFNLRRRGIEDPSDTLIWTTYQEGRAAGEF